MSKPEASAIRSMQQPARAIPQGSRRVLKPGDVPAVVGRGRFTVRQLKRALDIALHGQTTEADGKSHTSR